MLQFRKNLFVQFRQNYTTDYRLLIIARNEKLQPTKNTNIKISSRSIKKNKSKNPNSTNSNNN